MATTFVREERGREAGQEDRGQATGKRTYLVKSDSKTSSETAVIETSGIPNVWDVHPDVDWLRVRSRSAKQQKENPYLWDVTVEYTSDVVELTWDTTDVREALVADEDGQTFVNSAGLPFDPPPEEVRDVETLTIVKNMLTYDRDLYRRFRGAVNTDDWYGGPAHSSKCKRIRGQEMRGNGNLPSFYRVTFEFWILDMEHSIDNPDVAAIPGLLTTVTPDPADDPGAAPTILTVNGRVARQHGVSLVQTWRKILLDAGYEEWDVAAENYRKITTMHGQPVSRPAPLDGNASAIGPGEDPIYLAFRTFKRAEFAELDLP